MDGWLNPDFIIHVYLHKYIGMLFLLHFVQFVAQLQQIIDHSSPQEKQHVLKVVLWVYGYLKVDFIRMLDLEADRVQQLCR